jgi:DNA-binding transcriptional LysR family regulator
MYGLHMTLVQLQVYVFIATTGSFTAAAEALGMSQSAVSRALAALEQEVGAVLIERRRGNALPTAVGEQVLVYARKILDAADAIRQTAAQTKGMVSGRVRVGSFPSVSAQLLPEVLRILREGYPQVQITLFEGTDAEVREWIAARVVDVGFVVEPYPVGGRLTVLGDDPLVAVVADDDPLVRSGALAAADLAREPFILSEAGCGPQILAYFAAGGVALEPAYRVRDLPTLFAMVREGVGVTIAPQLALPEQSGGLTTLPLTPPLVRRLALASAEEQPAPAVELFCTLTARFSAIRFTDDAGRPERR